MLLALGALSTAFDALQSLTAKKSSSAQTGFSQTAPTPFDTGATEAQPRVRPDVLRAEVCRRRP